MKALIYNLETTHSLVAQSDIVQLIPKNISESTPNTYSGQYGYDDFPMHTDLAHWNKPPRYLMLRCLIGDAQVSTNILDSEKIIEAVGRNLLERSLVKPRRPVNGRTSLMKILKSGNPNMLRWDQSFIVAASSTGEKGISEVNKVLAQIAPIEVVLENTYDTVIIDNWRMLHSRTAVPFNSERKIERVYLGCANDS